MKKGLTELVFILDRSGSMYGLEKDTIGGFNEMLEKQKVVAGDCLITTVLFDDKYELLHDRIDIKAVSPITEKQYFVRGATALLDALGTTIKKIGNAQKNTAEEYRAEKVIFVIITDGQENCSLVYSSEKIKALIEYKKAKYAWEFIFLGANIDAVETAARFGIAEDRAVDYLADEVGTQLYYKILSDAVAEFRITSIFADDHLEKIRSDVKNRGGKHSKRSGVKK